MAEECDLDSLTALLDDSDMEDDTTEPEKKNSQTNDAADDGCDLDEITAFLEQSDSEDDSDGAKETYTQIKNDDSKKKEIETIGSSDVKETENDTENMENEEVDSSEEEDEDQPSEVNSIQAELLEMQKRMQELQQRLSSSQSVTPKPKKIKKNTSKSQSSDDSFNSNNAAENNNNEKKKSCTVKKESTSEQKNTGKTGEKIKENALKTTSCGDISSTLKLKSKQVDSPKNKYASSCSSLKNKSDKSAADEKNSKTGLTLQDDGENPFFPAKDSESDNTPVDRKSLEKSLFGDDDDSDWEPMGEDEKVKLSDEGHELSKVIKDSGKKRQSNVSQEEVEAMRKRAQKNNWKAKQSPTSKAEYQPATKNVSKENEAPCTTDPFSNIRIVNPKISSLDMKARMRDRKLVKISKIDRRVSEHDNWVTIGVITSKTEPRQSSTGKTYCIWKLCDLQDCDKVISFFLFGEVYKQHWKNEVTSVVGILNPNLMDKAEKAQNDMAFTVNHPAQIMMMGYSKDFGRCAAMLGKGNTKHCTNFINKQQGEFCTFHVQRAYSKKCSQRTELQGSYSGMTPNNHKYKPKDNKKDSFFFYQGQTYTTGKIPGAKENKKRITVDHLKKQQAMVGNKKVTTMSLHSIDPEDLKRLEKLNDPKAEPNPLLDMLTVPTPGSMNFVKHLMTKDQKPIANSESSKPIIQSVTAADLLKQHKQEMRQKMQKKTTGGITLTPPADPMKCTPTLGKGFSPGGNICLDVFSSLQNSRSEFARRKAIAKVQSKGGISKENPNAVKKKFSPEAQHKIKKRLLESHETESRDQNEEPPKKRSKLLGNIDENSEEFKKLMKARSKHTGALAEVEAEVEERYFMEQEKKERLEDKMASTMEVNATVFTCKQCNYTAYKVKDECKQQNHTIVKVQTKKRFFKCKKCGNRTTSFHKLPTQPCSNCGEDKFERVSMLQERKGPKLPHEDLCIRGDESKFIGSMNEKVYL